MINKEALDRASHSELVRMIQSEIGIRVIVRNATGDPPPATDGTICINKVDKTISMYADGAWRLQLPYSSSSAGSSMLLEDGSSLISEAGDKILLE